MKTKTSKLSDNRLSVLIPREIKDNYKIYCIKNNLILSKRVRELVEMDMGGKIKI